jgi:hypothetical protein
MRYSRFKQQMEGNAPVRRAPRNPNAKRTQKQKRSKDEDRKIKSEDTSSMNSPMMGSSPSATNPDASQESAPMTPEQIFVKLEPRENTAATEGPPAMPPNHYALQSPVALQTMTISEHMSQSEQNHPEAINHQNIPDYSFNVQPQQRIYQPLPDQTHMLMSQNLQHEMAMAAPRDYEPFLTMDMYPMNDMGCQGQMMGPMVKVEERWDPSYGQA